MKKALKRTCAICIVFCLVLCVAACSAKTDNDTDQTQATGGTKVENSTQVTTESHDPVTIRFAWWGGESRHKATVDAVNKFHEKYPYITVQTEYSGWSGYFEKLLTQFASKSAPDLVQLSYTSANEYVMRDQLYPLNDFINNNTLRTADLAKESFEMFKINDKYYAVPSGIMAQGYMVYNKDIFDKFKITYPGEGFTWDSYFEAARKLTKDTDGDGKTDLWGSSDIFTLDSVFYKMIYEQGGKLFSDDLKKIAFNSPEGLKVWTLAKSLLDEGIIVPPEVTASNPPGVDDFANGRCAISMTYNPALYESAKFKWDVVKAPRATEKEINWIVPSMIYSISNDSKATTEACMLLDYILNDAEAGNILKMERNAPLNKKIRDSLEGTLSETGKKTNKIIEDIIETSEFSLEPFPPGYIEVLNIWSREFENVIYNKKTVENALSDVEAEGNKVIEKFLITK